MFNITDVCNAIALLQHEYNLCVEAGDSALSAAFKTVINYLQDCM